MRRISYKLKMFKAIGGHIIFTKYIAFKDYFNIYIIIMITEVNVAIELRVKVDNRNV